MAKRDDLSEEQKEYQYDGEEFGEHLSSESPVEPRQSGLKAFLLNKKVLTLLGVVVAVFLIYQYLAREKHVLPEVALAQQKAVENPHPVENPVSVAAPSTTGLQTQIENLVQITQQNQAQVQQLQTNLEQTRSLLSQMGRHLEDLGMQVQDLDRRLVMANVSKVKKSGPTRPVYTVRAIIPGRAWLETSRGGTFSVAVGDEIARYGQVQIIDPAQGVVITSLGDTLRYGL